ncbi:styrene monooxygenase/indole monooxygenase family protein [Endozoicomonas arenosclerae]|uniref:styrene monooxygenase/indole monooxygenase family protein n=1 Tax=Endozoicomonas arenosclerae TaxID=1633495 RepID=UPI000780BD0A|nr:styrene monooxygenase/indole monooxygenase family protein [Endozoicomonas arenosclerae]
MRKITIVGAGQSGLLLGLGLLKEGYSVKIITDRTPEAVLAGSVMSTQCMFHSSLETERQLSLNHWEADCPKIKHIQFCATAPREKAQKIIEWTGDLDRYAQSVDQRIKFSAWMEEFEALGGLLEIRKIDASDLSSLAQQADLVIVATGKGLNDQIRRKNPECSPFDAPQRKLSLFYVQHPDQGTTLDRVSFNVIPSIGEYFVMPVLTEHGPAEAMLFEAIPEGPMDCFSRNNSEEERLIKAREFLGEYLPWEQQRIASVVLLTGQSVLQGEITPTVYHPVIQLDAGMQLLAMADAACLNDPITGQGSNNATKAADTYLQRILEHTDKPFDQKWMEDTFNTFWQQAQWSTQWSNMMLMPPPEFVLNLLGAAGQIPELANRIANAFDNPADLFPWFADEQAAGEYLQNLTTEVEH